MNGPTGHQDPYVPPRKQGDSGSAATGSCLKVLLVWGSPSLVVPVLLAMCGGAWPVAVIIAIAFLTWMGGISATDSSGRPGSGTRPRTGRVVLYVIVQLVWIPLFWMSVAWGFCAFTGAGKF